jgi:hypothetical protein
MIHGQVPVQARSASTFAITLESSNGANKPTGDKYLLGSISGNREQNEKLTSRQTNAPATSEPLAAKPPVTESRIAATPVTKPPDTVGTTDTRVAELTGTGKAPQARAHLVFDKNAGEFTVAVSDLPSPPAGKAYQLWYVVKGHPIPGNVFVTGTEGRAMIHGQVPVQARSASTFAITLESSNGANKPTGDKYLLGSIRAS